VTDQASAIAPAQRGGGSADSESEGPGPAAWLTVPEVAERLDVPVTKIRQMLRERRLLAFRSEGVLRIPADFVGDGHLLKGLPGLLTLLFDAGYTEDESLRWLYTADDSLPGTPVQALAENRGKEVHRRAQASAF
jgi:excisionase family DNA binding protein